MQSSLKKLKSDFTQVFWNSLFSIIYENLHTTNHANDFMLQVSYLTLKYFHFQTVFVSLVVF